MLSFSPIKRTLAGGLVVAAVAIPPAAQARFDLNPAPVVVSGSPAQVVKAPAVAPSGSSAAAGFQWGDAGIGAAGAVVLVSAGALGTGLARRRRTQRLRGA